MGSSRCIGVLALQGDFAKHVAILHQIGVTAKEVRTPHDLFHCDGLIIPGGESTSMNRQIDFIHMREPLIAFANQKPVFGTCAGLILMAQEVEQSSMPTLGLLHIVVERNAYGRQIDSFESTIPLIIQGKETAFPAIFIRAPRIIKMGEEVEVLATLDEEPVFIRQKQYLGTTFHPELTTDSQIHQYFVQMIRDSL